MHSYQLVGAESTQSHSPYYESDSSVKKGKGPKQTLGEIVLAASFLVGPTTAFASDDEMVEKGLPLILIDNKTNSNAALWQKPSAKKVSGATYLGQKFSSISEHHSNGWTKLSDALTRWASLSDGWAGPQSRAPSKASLENARRLKAMIMTRQTNSPEAYIDADGEIGFRWRADDKVSVIAFGDSGSVEAYIDDRKKNELVEIDSATLTTFSLDDFLGRAV
ncbi:hypothetical protein P8Q88_03465 [Qipengyuania sp. XHP0207]|uniref:hypothetical protein n=1 Tax=Qipengyuania sp. XHP0207 TaxID=3038078 RepID=UPI00241E2983|nr:hypothetical protein [Qipengyuania sp. XHP0207]MDG5747230.1 hypothetical protein [Qipengyuania sp. XHP0207]